MAMAIPQYWKVPLVNLLFMTERDNADGEEVECKCKGECECEEEDDDAECVCEIILSNGEKDSDGEYNMEDEGSTDITMALG